MKKLLCLFSATLLVLSSCSSDDNNSSDFASTILPKSVKNTYPSYPTENSTATISYDGNKIKSITDGDNRTDYVYDGNNQIVKITEFENGVKEEERTYTYANGKLVSSSYAENFSTQYPTGEYKGRSVYTYNTDGTVKTVNYSTDAATGVETKDSYETLSTITNGNLVKFVETDTKSGAVYTDVYEYDAKNSPLKNIVGFNLLVVQESFYSSNNVLKSTSSASYAGASTYVYTTVYDYNTNGFPIKATTTYGEGAGAKVDSITEYTY